MAEVGYQDRARFPWAKSGMLAAPAMGLILVSAGVGASSDLGVALLVLATMYVCIELCFLQPLVDRELRSPIATDVALEDFLVKAHAFSSIDEVVTALEEAIDSVAGDTATVALLAPSSDGGIQIVTHSPKLKTLEVGDRSAAIRWLGDDEEPLWRRDLEGLDDVGAIDVAELMDRFGVMVLVPLRHRGNLLGLLLTDSRQLRRRQQREFLAGLRTHATIALANTFLGSEARGQKGMVKVFGHANTMQASLMPEELPVEGPHWRLRGLFQPVADCGGDFWGWKEISKRKVLIVIADATGHGAAPALLSAVAKGTMDAYAQLKGKDCEPVELLEALNTAILRVGQRSLMMTAFAIIIDLKSGEMKYANAGQNFPYLFSPDTIEALVARGDQLGVNEDPEFELKTRMIIPGERLLLYTDGIVEAGQPQNAGFGERRFRKLVEKMGGVSAAEIPGAILAEVEAWLDGGAVHDDVTMVAFEYIEPVVPRTRQIPSTLLMPANGSMPQCTLSFSEHDEE